jgi:hypothetical protein
MLPIGGLILKPANKIASWSAGIFYVRDFSRYFDAINQRVSRLVTISL